jgi:hypothetical protein
MLCDIDTNMGRRKDSRIHDQDMNPTGFNPFFEKEGLFFLGVKRGNQ